MTAGMDVDRPVAPYHHRFEPKFSPLFSLPAGQGKNTTLYKIMIDLILMVVHRTCLDTANTPQGAHSPLSTKTKTKSKK